MPSPQAAHRILPHERKTTPREPSPTWLLWVMMAIIVFAVFSVMIRMFLVT